MLVDVK